MSPFIPNPAFSYSPGPSGSLRLPSFVRLAAAVLTLMVAACGSDSSVDRQLSNVETALADNSYENAGKMASRLSASCGEPGFMSARQLARLSIVYMHLADFSDEDTNTAIAVNYCREALEENPDSADAYYSQLSPDQLPYARTLMALVQNINHPEEIRPDSIEQSLSGNIAPDTAGMAENETE